MVLLVRPKYFWKKKKNEFFDADVIYNDYVFENALVIQDLQKGNLKPLYKEILYYFFVSEQSTKLFLFIKHNLVGAESVLCLLFLTVPGIFLIFVVLAIIVRIYAYPYLAWLRIRFFGVYAIYFFMVYVSLYLNKIIHNFGYVLITIYIKFINFFFKSILTNLYVNFFHILNINNKLYTINQYQEKLYLISKDNTFLKSYFTINLIFLNAFYNHQMTMDSDPEDEGDEEEEDLMLDEFIGTGYFWEQISDELSRFYSYKIIEGKETRTHYRWLKKPFILIYFIFNLIANVFILNNVKKKVPAKSRYYVHVDYIESYFTADLYAISQQIKAREKSLDEAMKKSSYTFKFYRFKFFFFKNLKYIIKFIIIKIIFLFSMSKKYRKYRYDEYYDISRVDSEIEYNFMFFRKGMYKLSRKYFNIFFFSIVQNYFSFCRFLLPLSLIILVYFSLFDFLVTFDPYIYNINKEEDS